MNESHLVKLILFVDDTNMFINDFDLKSLIVKANNDLCKLSLWFFQVNRLSLNVNKTNYFISKKKQTYQGYC